MSKKKHEWTRKGVTASMAVVLAFGMVPAVPAMALASTGTGFVQYDQEAETTGDAIKTGDEAGTGYTVTEDGVYNVTSNDGLKAVLALADLENGDTIKLNYCDGGYNLDGAHINKLVNLIGNVGANGKKPEIKGEVWYHLASESADVNATVEFGTVSVSNIRFVPAVDEAHTIALQWSNGGGNYCGFNYKVTDCDFVDWMYGVQVNEGRNNTLDVSNCSFESVWCAVSINDGEGNKLGTYECNETSWVQYELQNYRQDASGAWPSEYYEVASTKPVNPVTTASAPTSWPCDVRIGNVYFDSFQNALNAATTDCTVEVAPGVHAIGTVQPTVELKDVKIVGSGSVESGDRTTIEGYIDLTTSNGVEHGLTIENVAFDGNLSTVKALSIEPSSKQGSAGTLTLNNCSFENYTSYGLYAENADLSVAGCTFESTGKAGVFYNTGNAKDSDEFKLSVSESTFKQLTSASGSDGGVVVEGGGYLESLTLTSNNFIRAEEYYPSDLRIDKNDAEQATEIGTADVYGNGHLEVAIGCKDSGIKQVVFKESEDNVQTSITSSDGMLLVPSQPEAPAGKYFYGWKNGSTIIQDLEAVNLCDGEFDEDENGVYVFTPEWRTIAYPSVPSVPDKDEAVTENPDGSTTTTVTEEDKNADGSTVTTVTETTEGREDGSTTEKVTETTVSEDGAKTEKVTETNTLKDGTSATTVTVDGELSSAEATVTKEAVEAAGGKAVGLPMAPVAAAPSEKAVEVRVEAPAGAKVAVPVAKAEGAASVAPGAVLVLVDAEGNETVLPKTANGGSSLSAEVPGDCSLKVVDAGADFPDVDADDWYAEQGVADFVSARGIMTGVETGSGAEFRGGAPTNRGMFVTMLNRLEMEAKASSGEGFADVPEGSWYADSSAWAVEAGIATGYLDAEGNAAFNGEGEVTREQMATFLFRYAQWLGLDTSARADRDIEGVSGFAKEAVSWAVAEGLIRGDGETGAIRPGDGATRAEAAVVVMRMIDLMA